MVAIREEIVVRIMEAVIKVGTVIKVDIVVMVIRARKVVEETQARQPRRNVTKLSLKTQHAIRQTTHQQHNNICSRCRLVSRAMLVVANNNRLRSITTPTTHSITGINKATVQEWTNTTPRSSKMLHITLLHRHREPQPLLR